MNIYDFTNSKMFDAIIELNRRMIEQDLPKRQLNVVGGFALMIHQIRDTEKTTDIDYVGDDLSFELQSLSDKVGIEYGLGIGWVNNDLMLTGTSLEDLEYTTGPLHFLPAFDLEKLEINVLDEADLLKMKIISVDNAISAVEFGGEFTRMKDFDDIIALTNHLNLDLDDLKKDEELSSLLINEETFNYVDMYIKNGEQAISDALISMQIDRLTQAKENNIDLYGYEKPSETDSKPYKRSSTIDAIINDAINRVNAQKHAQKHTNTVESILAADKNSSQQGIDVDGDGFADYHVIVSNDNERISDVRDCDPESKYIKHNDFSR